MGAEKNNLSNKMFDFFTINWRMIPAKVSFLLYGGILGSHIPFLTVFFTSVGLSTSQAGFINGIRYVPATIAGPLWGLLADYTQRRKMIHVLLCVGSAIPIFMMPFVSYWIRPLLPAAVHSHNNSSFTVSMHSNLSHHLSMRNIVNFGYEPVDDSSITTLFYALLVIMMFGSIFVGPLPGYIDSVVMKVCKTSNDGSTYGAQRIYGSIGFSLASLICGISADYFKIPFMSRYTSVFCIYLPYTVLLIPFGYHLVGQARWDMDALDEDNDESELLVSSVGVERTAERYTSSGKITPKQHKTTPKGGEKDVCDKMKSDDKSMSSQLKSLFCQFDVIFFMLTALVSGNACSIYQSYAPLLAKDVLHATETEMGLLFVIATISEVVVFPFTLKLMNFFGGTSFAMTLGIFSYFVRFLIMSHTTQLWLMLLVQTLHAFGFALTWAAMMEYLHQNTPKEILLTMFLIFQSTHFGVAALLANIVGGIMYQDYGGQMLFMGKGIICGVWSFLMLIYYGRKYLKQRCGVRKTYEVIE